MLLLDYSSKASQPLEHVSVDTRWFFLLAWGTFTFALTEWLVLVAIIYEIVFYFRSLLSDDSVKCSRLRPEQQEKPVGYLFQYFCSFIKRDRFWSDHRFLLISHHKCFHGPWHSSTFGSECGAYGANCRSVSNLIKRASQTPEETSYNINREAVSMKSFVNKPQLSRSRKITTTVSVMLRLEIFLLPASNPVCNVSILYSTLSPENRGIFLLVTGRPSLERVSRWVVVRCVAGSLPSVVNENDLNCHPLCFHFSRAV